MDLPFNFLGSKQKTLPLFTGSDVNGKPDGREQDQNGMEQGREKKSKGNANRQNCWPLQNNIVASICFYAEKRNVRRRNPLQCSFD
jgi:hypothetical protein